MRLKERIREETLSSIEWSEMYEKNRDKAYKDGMKTNYERIEKLSKNEKEAKRHSCLVELNKTKNTITSLWEKMAEKTYRTRMMQRIAQDIMIAIFAILFSYAFKKDCNFFILTTIALAGFLAIIFLHLNITFEVFAVITGLASTAKELTDYYIKYGDLESILKLSDYRNLHASEVRKNITHSEITKDS